MRLILLGPPGAGKGTQSVFLSKHFGIPQVAMGDLLRNAVREDTVLGKEAKRYMENGKLVPDDLIVKIIKERLAASDCANGFILDGFPRTIVQANTLDTLLKDLGFVLDSVLEIKVPFSDLLARILNRRSCRNCQAVYHLIFQPPDESDKCDKCGGELYQRDDDREEVIRNRFDVYEKETKPLSDYYKRQGILKTVNGCGPVEKISQEALAALGVNKMVW